MALGQEWLLKVVKNLLPEDGLKVEKLSQLKMVKLERYDGGSIILT